MGSSKNRSRIFIRSNSLDTDANCIPGFRLHSLNGYENRWAINVSGNWRLTFDFIDGDAYLVDYEDYH